MPKHKEHELQQWLHNQHLLTGHWKYLSDVEVFFACLVHLGWLLACLLQRAEMGSIYIVWDEETGQLGAAPLPMGARRTKCLSQAHFNSGNAGEQVKIME